MIKDARAWSGQRDKWFDVWNKRLARNDIADDDVLSELIRADGFDTGFGCYTVSQWRKLVAATAELIGIGTAHRVLEIGCGAGAFLYELEKQTDCRIFGIDYSQSLINSAARYIRHGQFVMADAEKLPYDDGFFDVILAHSVLQYFPDSAYVGRVLQVVHRKLKRKGKLCLMDLNDKATEETYHEYRKRHSPDPEGYDQRYSGLNHLFFEKAALIHLLEALDFNHVSLFEHAVPEYVNARFRFNVLAIKD